jgi:hypothetical protein
MAWAGYDGPPRKCYQVKRVFGQLASGQIRKLPDPEPPEPVQVALFGSIQGILHEPEIYGIFLLESSIFEDLILERHAPTYSVSMLVRLA